MTLENDLLSLSNNLHLGRNLYIPQDFRLKRREQFYDEVVGRTGVVIKIGWKGEPEILTKLYQQDRIKTDAFFDPYSIKPDYLLDNETVLYAYIKNSTQK